MSDAPTVGTVRRFLATLGVPHTEGTHYLIIAHAGGEVFIHGCCDDITSSQRLLNAAGAALGQEAVPAAASPYVVVNRDDLRAALADGVVPADAWDRLSAAAEAGHG